MDAYRKRAKHLKAMADKKSRVARVALKRQLLREQRGDADDQSRPHTAASDRGASRLRRYSDLNLNSTRVPVAAGNGDLSTSQRPATSDGTARLSPPKPATKALRASRGGSNKSRGAPGGSKHVQRAGPADATRLKATYGGALVSGV